jgi:hypothetical protein
MKLVREATGLQMRYHADKTVEYVRDLGADKTGTTISPANQQLVDSVRVERDGGDLIANNLRVIGADGAGVDVSVPTIRFKREKWRRAYFRDTSDTETLRKRGETLLAELRDPWVKVQATVSDPPGGSIDPVLGDEYHVLIPPKDIDAYLEVVEVEQRVGPEGDTYDVSLSNRSQSGDSQVEKLDQAARDTGSGGGGSSSVSGVSVVATYTHSEMASIPKESSVTVAGDYLYVLGENSDGNYTLFIADVSSPSSPTDIGSLAPTVRGFLDLTVVQSWSILFATVDDAIIHSYDVSDPGNPVHLQSYSTTGGNALGVFGEYAYVAFSNFETMFVFDVSDPGDMTYIDNTKRGQGFHYNSRYIAIDEEAELLYNQSIVTYIIDVSTKSEPIPITTGQAPAHVYRKFEKQDASDGTHTYSIDRLEEQVRVLKEQ